MPEYLFLEVPIVDTHGSPSQSVDAKIVRLETAIRENRKAKTTVPDCPCWGNAPQLVDADLYAVLDGDTGAGSAEIRVAALETAIRKHREDKQASPECTCWITPTRKIDSKLYETLG